MPSWAYGNSGTRFKVFGTPGVPRNPFEKIADAAQVHAVTGLAPRVSLHIPWDRVDDYGALATHAKELGVRIGAINSNLFQDDDYKLGSLTHADERIRAKAVGHHLDCIQVMRETGSHRPEDLAARRHQLRGPGLAARPPGPAGRLAGRRSTRRSTTTSGCCWSTSSSSPTSTRWTSRTGAPRCCTAWRLGEQAQVVLDTGHHAPGTNIEFIVMQLLRQKRLGAFDFNSRFYADDDLIVGSADPFQLFRIMVEIVAVDAHRRGAGVNFMLDQCHNIEDKIPGQIRSVLNVEQALAKALLVDADALAAAQQAGDVLGAQRRADGRLRHRRPGRCWPTARERGPATRPVGRLRRVRLPGPIAADRVGGTQAGWGA